MNDTVSDSQRVSEPLFYRPADIIRLTGLSRSKIYNALNSGELRGIRKGGTWLIRTGAFEAWLESPSLEEEGLGR